MIHRERIVDAFPAFIWTCWKRGNPRGAKVKIRLARPLHILEELFIIRTQTPNEIYVLHPTDIHELREWLNEVS